MSPLEIKILLHYHCLGGDHEDAFNPPPAQQDFFDNFLVNGFLVLNFGNQPDTKYSSTEKLHVYCDALCKVPEPKQIWIVGENHE